MATCLIALVAVMLVDRCVSLDSTFSSRRPDSKFNTIVSVKSRNEVRSIYDAKNKDLSLSSYMKLPVSQYALIQLPLGATLTKVPNTEEFKLEVPNVKFFHLECKPTVYCTVSKSEADNTVTIRSEKCILGGSPMVDSLNAHYKFNVVTQFTWLDSSYEKAIVSNSKILVYVDPPLIFKAFPRSLLENTGNLVMQVHHPHHHPMTSTPLPPFPVPGHAGAPPSSSPSLPPSHHLRFSTHSVGTCGAYALSILLHPA